MSVSKFKKLLSNFLLLEMVQKLDRKGKTQRPVSTIKQKNKQTKRVT